MDSGATMKSNAWTVLPFPSASRPVLRRGQRKDLLNAIRVPGSGVVVDLSDCATLNHEDMDLLLECVAQVAGRDTEVVFVAGTRSNRVLLEITRIASLVKVCNSIEEALAYRESPEWNVVEAGFARQSEPGGSA